MKEINIEESHEQMWDGEEDTKEDAKISEKEDKRSPLKIIIAVFILIIIVMWAIPYYWIKPDPEPRNIPALREVFPYRGVENSTKERTTLPQDYPKMVKGSDPIIKNAAVIIATSSCPEGKTCQAKAEYYFVRDNIEYITDPVRTEYVETATETLNSGGADCDGTAVLLANLLDAIGIGTRFVFVPNHVYVQAYIPEASRKYKEGEWINLDATCKNCEFGQIPPGNREYRVYIDNN